MQKILDNTLEMILDLTLDIDIGQGEAAPFDLYLDVKHVTCVDLLFSQGM